MVRGTVVERRMVTVGGIAKRPHLTIRVEPKGQNVHAVLLMSGSSKIPDAVNFRYSGDPSKEVFLEEETSSLTGGLLFLGLVLGLAALWPFYERNLRQGTSVAQVVALPAPEDEERLATQRAVVEHYLGDDERSRENYRSAAGKLGLLRALLEQRVFKAEQTYELQCMGIVLGDAFVQELGMDWVMVDDAQGRDPAVRVPNTSIILFPLTMISKRIEQGEALDVFNLFNGMAAQVASLRTTGA